MFYWIEEWAFAGLYVVIEQYCDVITLALLYGVEYNQSKETITQWVVLVHVHGSGKWVLL